MLRAPFVFDAVPICTTATLSGPANACLAILKCISDQLSARWESTCQIGVYMVIVSMEDIECQF